MTAPERARRIREWAEEFARDAASPAFFPLARAYLEDGRLDAARRVCLRGLEHASTHVEAHVLLGRIYRALGDDTRAHDEWDIALGLDPAHRQARRELAFLCVHRQEWGAARRHIERLLQGGPDDADMRDALGRIHANLSEVEAAAPAPRPPARADQAGAGDRSDASGRADFAARLPAEGVLGAVLIDGRGYAVAGRVPVDGRDRAPEVAAALAGTADESERALEHLRLGAWRGTLMETDRATVHLSPVDDAMLAVAGERTTPLGWILRVAARLRREAADLLEPDGGR